MIKQKLILVLHNIRSRENVGSIFRTADAVGVSKIYLCGITPTPPHEKISKTALGAEMYVSWEYRKQTWRVLEKLSAEGGSVSGGKKVHIVALEQTNKSVDLFKFKPKFPLVLVLGNEIKGLSPKILEYCDKKISIPMYGKKESLNVSVAAGVALYTIIK